MNRLFLVILIIVAAGGCIHAEKPAANEPVGLAAHILEKPDFEWATRTSKHFRTHYLPGSTAEKYIDSLVEVNENSLRSQLAILGEENMPKTIDLFYFDSRELIRDIVTKPFRALAYGKLCVICNRGLWYRALAPTLGKRVRE